MAFIVLSALGFNISSSSVEYVAGWLPDDAEKRAEVLRPAAESVRRVAVDALPELEAS